MSRVRLRASARRLHLDGSLRRSADPLVAAEVNIGDHQRSKQHRHQHQVDCIGCAMAKNRIRKAQMPEDPPEYMPAALLFTAIPIA
jgi:hypothetical protein